MEFIKDPTRNTIDNFYLKYAKQYKIKSKVYLSYKIHCDVCSCDILYKISDSHLQTKLHSKNLKLYRKKIIEKL